MDYTFFMPTLRWRPLWMVLAGVSILLASAGTAMSQFDGPNGGGPGPGGFGPGPGRSSRGGGLASMLLDESVRQVLGITPEQLQKLQALQQAAMANAPDMRKMFSRNGSEQDRQAAFAAFREQMEKLQTEADAQLKTILTGDQFTQLKLQYVQQSGTRALTQADVAADLGLTPEQQTQIRGILEDRNLFADGRDMSSEDREKVRQEKILPLFSAEQRQKWDAWVASTAAPQPTDGVSASLPAVPPTAIAPPVEVPGGLPGVAGPPAAAPGMPGADMLAPPAAVPAPGTEGAMPPVVAGAPAVPGPEVASPAVPGPEVASPAVPGPVVAAPGVPAVVSTPPDGTTAAMAPNGMDVPQQVVSTFQADGTPTEGGLPAFLSFNFNYAPWPDVLKLFADASGLSIDFQAVPSGTFTYYDKAKYTTTEALDVLNGYLIPKGFILLRRDNFLVSLSIQAIPVNLVPVIDLKELSSRGKNELVSVILPLDNVTTQRAAETVQKLVGPQGSVVALETSNSLLVRDIGSNLRRIVALMSDVSYQEQNEPAFRSFPLKYIQATDAERQVRSLFGLASSVRNVSSNTESRQNNNEQRPGMPPWMQGGGRRGQQQDQQQQQQQQPASSGSQDMRVAADTRTNRLLVNAKPAQLKLVEEVLTSIDVPESEEVTRTLADNTPTLRVYEVQEADATEVTKTLDAIVPGVVVNEDSRNGYIHIMATPAQHREVEELIRRLDGSGTRNVEVIRLSRFDPTVAAEMLNSLFVQDGSKAPTIQPDPYMRTIAVRGTADQIAQIRKTLVAYGEDGSGTIGPSGTGRFRSVNLGGRDPERVARLIETMLSGNEDPSYEIRIVVPSDAGPVRERLVPGRPPVQGESPSTSAPAEQPAAQPGSRDSVRRSGPPVALAVYQAEVVSPEPAETPIAVGAEELPPPPPFAEEPTDLAAEGSAIPPVPEAVVPHEMAPPAQVAPPAEAVPPPLAQEAPAVQGASSTPAAPQAESRGDKPPARVNVEVRGDQLFLYSNDEKALDEVEMAIGQLAYDLPAESIWTVFYLQTADATETASRLKELIPQSSVATSSSTSSRSSSPFPFPFFGMGSSSSTSSAQATVTTQTLRIIADTRTNALFVTGPADKVKDVEQFLRVLDAADRPDSLRDRLPRTIPLQYADANDVLSVIQSLYADSISSGGSQPMGPMAMIMGGGNTSRSSTAKLTLSVDEQTNTLIVSASDALFREISDMVAELERLAYEAQPTTRIVAMDAPSSAAVQQALQSMTPKIQITTSSTTGTSGTTSSRSSQSGSSSGFGQRSGFGSFGGFGGPGGMMGGPGGMMGGPGGMMGGRGGMMGGPGGMGGGMGGFGGRRGN